MTAALKNRELTAEDIEYMQYLQDKIEAHEVAKKDNNYLRALLSDCRDQLDRLNTDQRDYILFVLCSEEAEDFFKNSDKLIKMIDKALK